MPKVFNILLAILISVNLAGCASRSNFQDTSLTPLFNIYNRNFIVASPTLIGNYVCGAPFFLLSGGIDSVVTGARSETYYKLINGLYQVPATACGAISGFVFIPFSYICQENPWYGDFKSYNHSWSCLKPG